jgi:excisionase family DNA binding protein
MENVQGVVRLQELPDCLTINEAARVLRLGRNSCYEAIRRGDLQAVKIGRRLVIPKAAIERLLAGE